MGFRKLLAVPLVLLAVVIFHFNEPLAPNTANPVKYKILAGSIKLHREICELKAWWTGGDYRVIQQEYFRARSLADRLTDPDVIILEKKFAGVPVYIYQPKGSKKNRPGLLYFHGGGFRIGHPVDLESLLFKFVKQLDMVVVNVDYRLAPSVKAPAAHDDCEKATQHFFINAEKYGVDPKMVGAGGDSCGGNLAASISLILRDQGEDQFAYQLLIYPWLQALDLQTPSYQRNCPNALSWMTYDSMASFAGSYLGLPPRTFPELLANRHVKPETWEKYRKYFNIDEIPKLGITPTYKPVRPSEINTAIAEFVEEDLTNPYTWPLLADDLSDLPPAYVLSLENDPIRDDAIWFANRLKRAGNKVLYDHSADGFHGMITSQAGPLAFDSAVRAADNMISFTREVLNGLKESAKDSIEPKAGRGEVNVKVEKNDETSESDKILKKSTEEVKQANTLKPTEKAIKKEQHAENTASAKPTRQAATDGKPLKQAKTSKQVDDSAQKQAPNPTRDSSDTKSPPKTETKPTGEPVNKETKTEKANKPEQKSEKLTKSKSSEKSSPNQPNKKESTGSKIKSQGKP